MRRLVLLTSAVVFIDVVFYTAITPLLPHYVEKFGLAKAEAAVLHGGYAAGTLLASLPAGVLATRFGPRRVLVWGLVSLGLASLLFGFAGSPALLTGARVVQGIAGAVTWAGALTWLTTTTPDARRGAAISDAFAAAIAGSLLGPLLGAFAAQVGAQLAFSSVLLVTLALAAFALATREQIRPPPESLRRSASGVLSRPVTRAAGYVAAPTIMLGALGVIVPLRVHDLGGGAGLIASGFAAAAALEALMTPMVGRFSDRAGRLRPISIGLVICAGAVAAVPTAETVGFVLALLIAASFGAGFCFTPAVALLSDAAEAVSLPQGMATGMINVAWAGAHVFGAVVGGVVAGAWGDAVPCLAASALMATTAMAARRAAASARTC